MSPLTRTIQSTGRSLTALALAIGLATPLVVDRASAQEQLPEIATAVPENAVLFHQLNLDFEGAQWQQVETLLASVGVPDAMDEWRTELLREGEASGDFTEADLDALIGGEAAFFITADAVSKMVEMHAAKQMGGHDMGDMAAGSDATPLALGEGEPLGAAAILAPGDPDAAWQYAQDQVSDLAAQAGVEVEQAQYGDAEIISVALEMRGEHHMMPDDMMGDDHFAGMMGPHNMEFAAGRVGDLIVAAPTQADIEAVVDVANGSAPSLADNAEAQNVVSQLPGENVSLTYLNLEAVLAALGPEVLSSIEGMLPPDMPAEAIGGAGAFSIGASEAGFRVDSFMQYPEGVDLTSVLAENDPAAAALAERAPEGTFIFEAGFVPPASFAGLPFSFSQAVNAATGATDWDEQQQMFPTPEQIEEEIAAATQTLGFNPATDLFELLGTEFIAFASFPAISMDGVSLDGVAAISTTDAATLAETMGKIAAFVDRAAPDVEVSVRNVGEDTLYVISLPDMGEAPSLEFGVLGDQAVVALGQGIAQLENAPATSLADDPQFQAVMAELPTEFYQVAYVDLSQAIGMAMMLSGEFGATEITDADLACTAYATQAEAQTAYDEDPVANSDLDLDFDGQACEDAFVAAGATPGAVAGSLENIRALAMVSYQQDNGAGSSAILYIAQPGS